MNSHRKRVVCRVLFCLAGLLVSACFADTVYLKNGNEVNGTVIEDSPNTVVIKLKSGGTRSFRRADVETVVYERQAVPAAPENPPEAKAVQPDAVTAQPGDKAVPENKTDEGKTPDANNPGDKTDAKEGDKPADSTKDEEKWTPPPGLAGFPENAKRMDAAKEKLFKAALDKLADPDEAVREKAKAGIQALGPDALPYVVAGINHANVYARTICMDLIGSFNGKSATKYVLEIFFAAMPDAGGAATYQVPFIRSIKQTLGSITGQSFITVEPKSSMVQDGLRQYVAWYNDNYDQLPPQLGEAKLDPTDPAYGKKLKEARQLKLEKRTWPKPPMPADSTTAHNDNNRTEPTADEMERSSDKNFRGTIPTVDRGDPFKR